MYTVDCSYNLHSGYATGADSLESAVSKAQWARDYYEPMYPGTVRVAIWAVCAACDGRGRKVYGRKNARFPKYKDCACCNAQGRFPVPAVC